MSLLESPRWSTFREFVDRWYREPLTAADPALLEPRLQAAEERLGCALPQALREWYRLVAERLEPYQDDLVEPEELRLEGDFLPLLAESQGNWFFGIRRDAEGEDPPVFFKGESQAFASLSEFCLFTLRWQTAMYSALERQWVEDEDEEEDLPAPFGQVAPGVRGCQVDPEEMRYPTEGLQLRHTVSIFPEWLEVWEAPDTLLLQVQDGSDPPELVATLIATRTAVAEEQVEVRLLDASLERDRQQEAAQQAKHAREAQERVDLGVSDDAELLRQLEALQDRLRRYELSLLSDYRQALALGTLRDAQRARALEILTREREA